MNTYTLRRSGDAPLKFTGALIAESSGKRFAGRERTRYHDLALYRTDDGAYVVEIAYVSRYQGDPCPRKAIYCRESGDVVRVLRDYDPTEPVVGFPEGEAYAERQRKLLQEIRSCWDDQVAELLDGDEFAQPAAATATRPGIVGCSTRHSEGSI